MFSPYIQSNPRGLKNLRAKKYKAEQCCCVYKEILAIYRQCYEIYSWVWLYGSPSPPPLPPSSPQSTSLTAAEQMLSKHPYSLVDFSGPSKYQHVSPSVWPEFPNTTVMHTANQHACPQLNGVCVFTITIKWACYKTSKSTNEWTGRSQLLSSSMHPEILMHHWQQQ